MDSLLKYFFENLNREYHVRELAKFTKKSPTTISKHLSKLKKDGVLKSEKRHHHLFFRANTDSPLFRDLKLADNLHRLRQSGLIDFLTEEFNHPEAILLFGSYRKAEDLPRSDIDILIITPVKKELDLSRYEKKLGHAVQLFLHSNQSLEKMKTRNKELLNNFVNGFMIEGYWELFK